MITKVIFSLNLLFIFIFKTLKYNKNYFTTANAENLINKKRSIFRVSSLYSKSELKNIKSIEHLSRDKIYNLKESFFRVDINKVCSDTGKKIFDNKFPLYKASLEIIENDSNFNFSESFLNQYLKNFDPKNYAEVFNINNKKNILAKLSKHSKFYPWMHSLPQRHLSPGLFGPKKNIFIKYIFERLQNLISSMIKCKYVIDNTNPIMGYLMLNNNDYRFIITSGTHRTSVISALYNKRLLNLESFICKFDNYRIKEDFYIIDINKINSWPAVKKGYISKKDAYEHFHSYFA